MTDWTDHHSITSFAVKQYIIGSAMKKAPKRVLNLPTAYCSSGFDSGSGTGFADFGTDSAVSDTLFHASFYQLLRQRPVRCPSRTDTDLPEPADSGCIPSANLRNCSDCTDSARSDTVF
jgi:hypothetical protein